MLILTDFPRFPKQWTTSTGVAGISSMALAGASPRDLLKLIPEIRKADLILVHESGIKVLWLVLLFWIMPALKKPIVSVDIILRKPYSAKEKLGTYLVKILLKRVDHFIHYFKKLDGYETIYGIPASKSSYVPFKGNLYKDPRVSAIVPSEKEEYVLSVGWSLRDFDTFFEAVSKLGYLAAIPRPDLNRLKEHGARFTRKMDDLPKNLVMLDDDGSQESWMKILGKARIVVIPILRDSIRAAGISVYLDAMLLKKCVIITDGPGVSDVLTDQAVIVPSEDPTALAAAIQKVWVDPAVREKIALRGYNYAMSLGGEPELMSRVLERAVSWYQVYTAGQ